MSTIYNTHANPTRNINAMSPLSPETEKTLKKYIFPDLSEDIQQGCQAYQSLAKRATYLNGLNKEFISEKIDLGKKDRMWAIAKCILVLSPLIALITGIALMSISFTLTSAPIYLAGQTLAATGFVIPKFEIINRTLPTPFHIFSPFVCVPEIKSALEIFSRPSPDQLKKELETIEKKKITKERINQIIIVEDNLTQKIQSLNGFVNPASIIDRKIAKQKKAMQLALKDVQRLRIAISG